MNEKKRYLIKREKLVKLDMLNLKFSFRYPDIQFLDVKIEWEKILFL